MRLGLSSTLPAGRIEFESRDRSRGPKTAWFPQRTRLKRNEFFVNFVPFVAFVVYRLSFT
jgi:hypothetical protein